MTGESMESGIKAGDRLPMAISPWIRGVVEHGDARGRTIGLPTANIPPTGRSGTGLGRNGPGGVGPGR